MVKYKLPFSKPVKSDHS